MDLLIFFWKITLNLILRMIFLTFTLNIREETDQTIRNLDG